jgi:hypothetical protein
VRSSIASTISGRRRKKRLLQTRMAPPESATRAAGRLCRHAWSSGTFALCPAMVAKLGLPRE